MKSEALKVFRVHGLYYSVLKDSNGIPSGFGKEFVAEIPSDAESLEVWKRTKIQYFSAEKVRLHRLRKRSPSPISYRNYWGYIERPSITEPHSPGRGAWVYIVDLDTDTFTIKAYYISRKFRLDMIPSSLFAFVSNPAQLMVSPVPQSHMADSFTFDPEFFSLYKNSQPRLLPPICTIGHGDRTTRAMLRQMLIRDFLNQYDMMIEHANRDTQVNVYTFRQLAYGLLTICDISTPLSFERVRLTNLYHSSIGSGRFAIPSWDPPASSEYLLSSVIIILEPRMEILEFLQAAIGKAVSMAKTRPESRTAIILSLDSTAIVHFTRNDTDGELTVSHTDNLLFCPTYLYCSYERIPSAGINAVIQAFASNVNEPSSAAPARLPCELWEEIFRYSIASSQAALERTCRFFRSIAQQLPRVDGWTLERVINDSSSEFVGARNGERREVWLETRDDRTRATENAYQTVLWAGNQRVELGLPLRVVGGRAVRVSQ